MKQGYLCYCLCGKKNAKTKRGCTYVGITNNFKRRLRQHNGELKGGARYTHAHRPWNPIFHVYGFRTKNEVLRFEWAMKHRRRTRKGATPMQARLLTLEYLLSAPEKESTASMVQDLQEHLHIHLFCSRKHYMRLLGKKYTTLFLNSPHRYTFSK